MKKALACLVLSLMACGSKAKPAAVPANKEPAAGGAATCCCMHADKTTKMEEPGACTSGGGTCEATEDSCHGIEGPIP